MDGALQVCIALILLVAQGSKRLVQDLFVFFAIETKNSYPEMEHVYAKNTTSWMEINVLRYVVMGEELIMHVMTVIK
jgi:hypothetical protein